MIRKELFVNYWDINVYNLSIIVLYYQIDIIQLKKGVYTKGFLEFKTAKDEVVKLKMGISPVSSKNALENIEAEINAKHWKPIY